MQTRHVGGGANERLFVTKGTGLNVAQLPAWKVNSAGHLPSLGELVSALLSGRRPWRGSGIARGWVGEGGTRPGMPAPLCWASAFLLGSLPTSSLSAACSHAVVMPVSPPVLVGTGGAHLCMLCLSAPHTPFA